MKKKISSVFYGVATFAMFISAVMFVSCSDKKVISGDKKVISGDKKVISGDKKVISGDKNRTFNVRGVEFEMVYVEGGTFMMGSNDSESDRDERPVHRVTLSDYLIGETEVTQALWQAVMGSNPSEYKGANRPVETVSWNDCWEFIIRLNRLTGENFCLPTEAQWEFAARGGICSKGYKYSGSNDIDSVAWYYGNACYVEDCGTRPVATKQPNELGIYDMIGNVGEWCEDWYGDYTSNAVTDPQGPSYGSYRVHRGGSWGFLITKCRNRFRSTPSDAGSALGLRLALK